MKTDTQPRAPAARAKLEQAEKVHAGLSADVALLALGASEGAPGAAKALDAHRIKVEAADRSVAELRAAVELAERLDRQTAATAIARIRADQLSEFKAHMTAREKAMAKVLEAAATMAAAYGEYSEATLIAQVAAPSGTAVPVMSLGPNGILGAAFGPAEKLILVELWRLAPQRADGIGRFVLPFAKPPSALNLDVKAFPPALDEMRAANQAILTDITSQVAALDQRAMAAAASKPKKEAA